MNDVLIRTNGRAGHVTLNRPSALNALTADMAIDIETALDVWRDDPSVALIVLDAVGEKAFCAGGDIAELYEKGCAGEYEYGRAFWRQEYRLNLKIATYPKPVVVFMQGYTMGGGVGIAGHASHRIVGESSQIAMPECGIGLIPDVGGSYLLGRGAGNLGVYLGLTGSRMGAQDAIYATFADHFVPQTKWDTLKTNLIETADTSVINHVAASPEGGTLAGAQTTIDRLFSGATLSDIHRTLTSDGDEFATASLRRLAKGSPLALSCALKTIRAANDGILTNAFIREFRYSYRSQEQGDFIEGIRAQIIDRDFKPSWRHAGPDVPQTDISAMLADLGPHDWIPTGDTP